MKNVRLLIVSCLFIFACTTEQTAVELAPQLVPVEERQTLFIQLAKGEVEVVGSASEQVQISGQTFAADESSYKVISTIDQIQITASDGDSQLSQDPISLYVRVPNNVRVQIETSFAPIFVHDYEGNLDAASVSGDISIQNVNGIVTARSNRGNVSVEDSTGKISVVGNYGLLTLEDVSGSTGVSTIMGTITFNGRISEDDVVRLETDHGSITVTLSSDSSLTIQVRSTSGDVICPLPEISSSLRTCDGTFNSGGGILAIRTVSGAIAVQTRR
jgi:hypothetical protein